MKRRSRVGSLRRFVILVMLLVSLGTAGAGAAPQPGSGVWNLPTGDLMALSMVQGSLLRYQAEAAIAVAAAPFRNWEVGAVQSLGSVNMLGLSVKYRLLSEDSSFANLVLGADTLGRGVGVYAAVSRELFRPGARVHAAFGSGQYDGAMVGATVVLNPVVIRPARGFSLPVTTAAVEYDGRGINAGFRFRFNEYVQAQVFLERFETLGLGIQVRASF